MNKNLVLALSLAVLSLGACHKKAEETAPAAETPAAPAPTASAPEAAKPAAEQTDAEREMAHKKELMDYATMEDTYINDPKAQWSSTANASSVFGDQDGQKPSDSSLAINATGKLGGNNYSWINNNREIGFDTLELGYDKPVFATEVRAVLPQGNGANAAESLSKVELQDTTGKWNTIWSGISDVKRDDRGSNTWLVRKFDKTTYQVKAVKYTFANNLAHGYKEVNAAQLVGE